MGATKTYRGDVMRMAELAPNKADVIDKADLDKHPWYYSIELTPGIFSKGQEFPNVALTRELLDRTCVRDQRCLDIGTMEGLVAILLSRRNAREVIAYDRPSAYRERVNSIKAIYHADFQFVSGFEIRDLPDRVRSPFDVVVFSGVLYHMFDPFGGLATVRGIVRNGGIVIVETAAAVRRDHLMFFNAADRFAGGSYFIPSLPCLDYMIRFLRMRILDCEHLHSHWVDGVELCRIALACRAEHQPIGSLADKFIHGTYHTEMDIASFLDWREVESIEPQVAYSSPQERSLKPGLFAQARRRITGIAKPTPQKPAAFWQRHDCWSLDLHKTVTHSQPLVPSPTATKLTLADN